MFPVVKRRCVMLASLDEINNNGPTLPGRGKTYPEAVKNTPRRRKRSGCLQAMARLKDWPVR